MESRNASRPNRLIKEKSPYLLQHAHNPVDWYTWGKEAFDKAREENKPVFLSIGYSTCHWCHVMEKESFEDPDVAKLLNKFFICIKVDREERPDVDGIYMTVCQMLTQRGGWPLTIMMTPDKKPFFAATYLPKTSRFRQTGLLELIPRIHRLWTEQKEELVHSAARIIAAVKASSVRSLEADLGENILHTAFQHISRTFDQQHGGFSAAPKFPTPHILTFLLRYWSLTKKEQALFMVEKSLTGMRQGGIFDHVGYGFHRYSTDARWLLPHFEKMIYDQALLAMAYTETFQATKNSQYREVAEEIFTYVLSQMTSPDGGFFSAEDADSEGEEGKFYTWSLSEIMNALTQQEADLAILAYNLEKEGNFQDEATGSKSGRNVLYFKKNLEEISSTLKLESKVLPDGMERIRQKLWAARKERVHPLRDEKILSDWNGLMIAALAKGGRIFENSKYTNAAQKASEFILERMTDKKGELLHRYKDGEASIEAYADDYAFLIWGLLELFETTFLTQYLQQALQLNQLFIRHFWDEQEGAFFFTSDKAESLPLRRKEIYDGAIPSSNSVAMLNLLKLGRMTANPDLENKAHQIGKHFSGEIARFPSAYTQMLTSLHFSQSQSHEIVIVGNSQQSDTREMIKAVRSGFIPNKVVLFVPSEEKNPDILKLVPFLADYKALDAKATAYVCSSYTCKNPTTKSELMLRQLTQP